MTSRPPAAPAADAEELGPDEPSEQLGRFASLALRDYRQLLIGGLFMFLAMQMAMIARSWLAYELTGTNTALGGVLLGFGVSSLIAIPLGGVLADRFPKRRVLVAAGLVQTLTSLLLGLAVVADVAAYWMLVVASVVQGAAISLLGPARLAFMAEVVDRDRLTNAVFLSQSTMQFTRVFGPAVAGVLIGVNTVGIGGGYFMAAGASLLAVLFTLGLPPGYPTRVSTRSPTEDLLDGLRFVRSRPELAHLLVLSFVVVLVAFPHIAFLPAVAEDIFDTGSGGFGAFTTAAAVGALASSLALANLPRRRLWPTQNVAGLLFGVTLVVFALSPWFAMALLAMVAVGGSSASFQALNNSLALTISPVEYHGRVQSLLMLSFSGLGLAALPLGILADTVGLRPTMVGMGVAVVIIMTLSRRLRGRAEAPGATL